MVALWLAHTRRCNDSTPAGVLGWQCLPDEETLEIESCPQETECPERFRVQRRNRVGCLVCACTAAAVLHGSLVCARMSEHVTYRICVDEGTPFARGPAAYEDVCSP